MHDGVLSNHDSIPRQLLVACFSSWLQFCTHFLPRMKHLFGMVFLKGQVFTENQGKIVLLVVEPDTFIHTPSCRVQ